MTIEEQVLQEFKTWLEITEQKLIENAKAADLEKTKDLIGSIRAQVDSARGTRLEGSIAQLVRGRFRDMGERKIKADRKGLTTNRRKLTDMKRRQKKHKSWYSRTFYGRLNALLGILGMTVANEALEITKENLPAVIK